MSNSAADICGFLSEHDNFVIIPHVRPDGDAIGSAFGLRNALRENGKQADTFLLEAVPDNYVPLLVDNYQLFDNFPGFENYSACIIVDTSTEKRIGIPEAIEFKSITIPTLNIDHHPDNSLFGEINLVQATTAATSEIILQLIQQCPDWRISPKTATLLLTGLVMDTGCFRFDNTSPEAMRSAAELLQLGADYHNIIKNMFFSSPLNYLQFQSDLLLNHLHLECDGKYAWLMLNDSILKKYDIDLKNIEGLIDSIRAIAGVEIAALLVARDQGYKISLRSKNLNYSVGEIARKLDGGGHELAAGGFIEETDYQKAAAILKMHVETIFSS